MPAESIPSEALLGTWTLVRSSAVDVTGKPIADPWGPEPMGSLTLTRQGRMMAVLCDGRTNIPQDEVRTYSSYCGNYRFDGERLTTVVDAASDLSRIGSRQVREIELRGPELVLRPPRRDNGEQRELTWRRVAGPDDQ